ncbi:MAG TPA: HAD family hydrolase [Myxococcales bacterium]|jgi:putative hydrolase of the HAD superfamily
MLRAVFFDLYGTLVTITTDEADPRTAAAFERWVSEHLGPRAAERERSHPFLADLRAIRPFPVEHAEPDIAPVVAAHLRGLLERQPSAHECEAMAAGFRAASRRELSLIPGVREALLRLKERFRVGLISNAQILFTRPELAEVGLSLELFDPAIVSSELGIKKPSRHIFLEALARAGVAAGEAMHVGNDAFDDVAGASTVGLRTCLVDDPRRKDDGPRPPDLRLRSVAELPDALLGRAAPPWVR